MKPPIPKKIKKTLSAHGDKRIDYYYWLRDDQRKNKTVHNPITYNFTKKYIYFYYAFFWILLLLFVFTR